MYLGFLVLLSLALGLVLVERGLPALSRATGHQIPLLWTLIVGTALVFLFAADTGIPLRLNWWREILASVAIFALPLMLTPARWRRSAAATIATLLAFIVLADLVYFRFFDAAISFHAWRTVPQVWDVRSIIAELVRWRDLNLLLVPISGLALVLLSPARSQIADRRWRHRVTLATAGILAWILVPTFTATWKDLQIGTKFPGDLFRVSKAGIFYAHLFEATVILDQALDRPTLTPEQRLEVGRELAERARQSASSANYGTAKGANLLLVQVEALPTFLLQARVGGETVMPFLQSLRQQSLYFPNVLDQTAQGRTSDAEYLVLNSLHPLPQKAICFAGAGGRFVTIASALRDAGYTTVSAHAYNRGFWNRAAMHPAYGFDKSWFRRELGDGEQIGWGLADQVFFQRLVDRLRDQPQPFFAFAITLSLHPPYDYVAPQYQQLPVGRLAGTHLGAYLNLGRHFDNALRLLITDLERAGLRQNTVIALYGDHTMGGFEAENLEAVFPIEDANIAAFHSSVPFLVLTPDRSAAQVDTPIGQIDIGPTLLHLLGVERPRSFLGRPAGGGIGFAARWKNEVAVGRKLLAERGRCFDRTTGRGIEKTAECERLIEQARHELGISYAITTHDLAAGFAAADPS